MNRDNMQIFLSKTANVIKNKKKKIISFSAVFVLSIVSFISSSISSLSFSNNSYESLAKKMGYGVYDCEVTSPNPKENFRSLFNYSDDMAGKEIKNYLDSFILSSQNDDYTPVTITTPDSCVTEIKSVLQYTTWQFHKYNYGLKTYKDEKHNTRELAANEIYINDKVADSLMLSSEYASYDDLVGIEINCIVGENVKKLKIVDIVTNLGSINLGPYFSECSIITRYVNTANWFSNLKYVYILRGGPLSKTYSLTCIEGSMHKLNNENKSYFSHYFKLNSNKLVDDGINDLKTNTFLFYFSGFNKRLILFLILTLICLLVLSILTINGIIGRESVISIFSSFILYALILRAVDPLFIIGGKIVILSNMAGSIILLSVFVLLICLYFLLEPYGIKKKLTSVNEKRKEQ